MRRVLLKFCLILSFLSASAQSLTVEEQRLSAAQKAMPKVVKHFDHLIAQFAEEWDQCDSFDCASEKTRQRGHQLWKASVNYLQDNREYDDRPLYWARLKMSKIVRTGHPKIQLTPSQIDSIIDQLEASSRGHLDLHFTTASDRKILLTGFDPFLLDRNIKQSNPSGVAALLMDGMVIERQGVTAEIQTVMIPVRFRDFDVGLIEQTLAPFYATNRVDLVATVSMGRSDFDLERFPGLRRSAVAPDNLNIMSGATAEKPVIPQLGNVPLSGPEFVEFSLPADAMQTVKGKYKVNDNRKVTTLDGSWQAKTLQQLDNSIAVEGSGGGYLSNEISYRSIRLKNLMQSDVSTGHIHTPRIGTFSKDDNKAIMKQLQAILESSLQELNESHEKN